MFTTIRCSFRLCECLSKVTDDIDWIFQAHGESHEPVSYACCFALCRRNVCVGHRSWMRDQRFRGAKVFGECTEFDVVHETNARIDSAFNLECDERAAGSLLFAREFELWKRIEPGIE